MWRLLLYLFDEVLVEFLLIGTLVFATQRWDAGRHCDCEASRDSVGSARGGCVGWSEISVERQKV